MKTDSVVVLSGAARVLRWLALTLLLGSALPAEAWAQMRTWTDSTGKHKMQAKFVEVTDGKVKLENEKGGQFAIDLTKLSEADQKYVAEQANQANPFQAVPSDGAMGAKSEDEEEPRFTPKKRARQAEAEEEEDQPRPKRRSRRAAAEEDEEEDESDEASPREVRPRWTRATAVTLTPTKEKWRIKISPPDPENAIRRTRAIPIPAKEDFFEGLKSIAVNPIKGWAVLGYTWDKHGKRKTSRVVICDLRKGKCLGGAWTARAGLMKPLAMRDNGVELLMCSDEFGHGKHGRLELWKMTSEGISRLVQWVPYEEDQDVTWAEFVDADRLATMSRGGRLALWSMEKVQPICYLDTKSACIPALSPDRKYIAFATDESVGMFDVEAQEVAALTRCPTKITFPVCRFTPQGTRLLMGTIHNRIYVWDVATGGLYRDIWIDKVRFDENTICPSEDHVLVGNRTLIDLDSQFPLWSYTGHDRLAMLGGTCLFVASEHGKGGALVPAVLPQPGVREALKKALSNPDFFVLQPGTTVRLNVSAIPDPGEREKAATALTQKLMANGFSVGPSGNIELAASTEATKQIEVGYHSFGSPGTRIYKMQEYVSHLRFVYQGKNAWEGRTNNVPGMLSLKQGETIDQALRQHEKPNYHYFQVAELPRLLANPSLLGNAKNVFGSSTLGTSTISSAGIQ